MLAPLFMVWVIWQDPKPHATVAWAVGDWRPCLDEEASKTLSATAHRSLFVDVRNVVCSIGDRFYSVAVGGGAKPKGYARYKRR